MPIELEGGCRVTRLKEGQPQREGTLMIWNHFGGAFSTRVIEVNGSAVLRNDDVDEVLFVISGDGSLAVNTSVYLPATTALEVSGEALTLFSCRVPRKGGELAIVSLDDKPLQKTGDRCYRELITAEVTQFVGVIPPGRAPDHFHLYEEVICILDGSGAMWAGATSTQIESGSCIFLPRRQMHCVENRGSGDMKLLGVFYPAGSPAVRYSDPIAAGRP